MTLTQKEKYYYAILTDFYKKCGTENIQLMLDIINGNSMLSLRIIDWFVTRCSYKYKLCIENGNELFNIYISYKAQLKSYRKKYFDPFRRNTKFCFHYDIDDDKKYICTTFGQLNFFKWAISNNIIKFIIDNFDFVLASMSFSKNNGELKKDKIINNDELKMNKNNDNLKKNKNKKFDNFKDVLKQKSKILNKPIVLFFD